MGSLLAYSRFRRWLSTLKSPHLLPFLPPSFVVVVVVVVLSVWEVRHCKVLGDAIGRGAIPHLETLNMFGARNIGDEGLVAIIKGLEMVSGLGLADIPQAAPLSSVCLVMAVCCVAVGVEEVPGDVGAGCMRYQHWPNGRGRLGSCHDVRYEGYM